MRAAVFRAIPTHLQGMGPIRVSRSDKLRIYLQLCKHVFILTLLTG
jgi:hypothetical protein